MAIQKGFVDMLVILLLVFSLANLESATAKQSSLPFNRGSFPDGFIFGTASSSYQYEGAAGSDGRSPSIWDTYSHKMPGRIADRSNGDVAIDFYYRYKEDVHKMKDIGTDAFRFSISWSRILPSGKLSGGVNEKGINFYNNLINELLANDQQPIVTLFHWDLPQALEDEYGGFLSPRIVKDFQDFAEVCFKEFGDRVKHWITLNEPWVYASMGYDSGQNPPVRCSKWVNKECKAGNSATEPYQVGHNMLLAHAAASNLYRSKYKASQKGTIGITLVGPWEIPYSNSKADIQATKRLIDFMFGWYMDPLTFGDYPWIMHTIVGERLPKFTKEQSKKVKGSADFIGINYYTTSYVFNVPPNTVNISYSNDARAKSTRMRNGVPIGPVGPLSWLSIYPKGIRDLLVYTKKKYNNPPIYITENGFDDNSTLPTKGALNDTMRILYLCRHFLFLQRAIKEGVHVKGYFAWSLLDNFEWNSGYSVRFGLYYVDHKNGLKRYPKQSALWFKEFLQHKKKN